MAEKITIEHLHAVLNYMDQHSSITNRKCRDETGVGYDSAIKIFGALCATGLLNRIGEKGGTKYVSPYFGKPRPDPNLDEHLTATMDYLMKHGWAKHE